MDFIFAIPDTTVGWLCELPLVLAYVYASI